MFLDAAALAGHLVPTGSMFAFWATHLAEVFPDAGYADLFSAPGVGRPSLPATQMAAVMTLQAVHDYSDSETAEAVRFDVRWKVAIGSSLDDEGFDPSSLVYWRRLVKSGRPHRVNNAVKTVIEQTGVLKGRRAGRAPGRPAGPARGPRPPRSPHRDTGTPSTAAARSPGQPRDIALVPEPGQPEQRLPVTAQPAGSLPRPDLASVPWARRA